MQYGNWIPISKAFSKALPHDRAYTELEAAYSMTLDYDNMQDVTIKGYANLWRWSRGKVRRFLRKMSAEIKYQENTKQYRNQRGILGGHITDIKRTYNGHIRLIENNTLPIQTDIKQTLIEHKADTTIEPNPNPNPKKKIFCLNSNEFRLSNLLYSFLLKINSEHKEPNLQEWAKHIDWAIRIDKRAPEDLEEVICWVTNNNFWSGVILSTSSLRKNYDAIKIQMNKKEENEYKLSFIDKKRVSDQESEKDIYENQESIDELCS